MGRASGWMGLALAGCTTPASTAAPATPGPIAQAKPRSEAERAEPGEAVDPVQHAPELATWTPTISVPVVSQPLAPLPADRPVLTLTSESISIDGNTVVELTDGELSSEARDKVGAALVDALGWGQHVYTGDEWRESYPGELGWGDGQLIVYASPDLPYGLFQQLLVPAPTPGLIRLNPSFPEFSDLALVAENAEGRGVIVVYRSAWGGPPIVGSPWEPALIVHASASAYELVDEAAPARSDKAGDLSELGERAANHVHAHPNAFIAAVEIAPTDSWARALETFAALSPTLAHIELLDVGATRLRGEAGEPFAACQWVEKEGACRAPDVRGGKPTIDGALDPEFVRRIVRAHLPEVQECWSVVSKGDYSGVGSMELSIAVSALGKVETVNVDAGTVSPRVVTCTKRAVRTWRFPKSSDQQSTSVIFTLELALS